MALYQINISYDGTAFHGYQRQINQRTVQGELENALKMIGWKGNSILSSGRTDRGVHAERQVAAFSLEWNHSTGELQKAINSHLPSDVAIMDVRERPDADFHPRYSAKSRVYRYQIYTNENRHPLLDRYNWQVYPKPAFDQMQSAALIFIGQHDFKRFGKPYETGGRTERIIEKAFWMKCDDSHERMTFHITGNSFLYHMVRRIAFLLVLAGQQKIEEAEITNALCGTDNLPPGIAPARGLFLEKINY